MNADWLLAIIPMLLVLIIAIVVRSQCKSWINPSAYFTLAVILYFLLPFVLAPDFKFLPGGMWWILASVMAFLSGSMTLTYAHERKPIRGGLTDTSNVVDSAAPETCKAPAIHLFPFINMLLVISIILGTLSSILLLLLYGKSIGVFLSSEGLVGVGSEFSVLRYSGIHSPPIVVQILLPFSYTSPLLGGIIMAFGKNNKQRALSLLSFVPSLAILLIQTTKAAMMIAFILFISAYFAIQVLLGRKHYRLFTRNTLLAFLAILLVAIPIYSFAMMARNNETPSISGFNESLRSPNVNTYLFGHASAFSQWFQKAWDQNIDPHFGAATFGGVLRIFGPRTYAELQTDTVSVSSNGTTTNIYSIYRVFIEDFSFAGSLLFLFIFGLLASFVYFKVGNGSLMLFPMLIAIYVLIGMQITSVFRFTSVVAAFFIIQVYVITAHLLQRRKVVVT